MQNNANQTTYLLLKYSPEYERNICTWSNNEIFLDVGDASSVTSGLHTKITQIYQPQTYI